MHSTRTHVQKHHGYKLNKYKYIEIYYNTNTKNGTYVNVLRELTNKRQGMEI